MIQHAPRRSSMQLWTKPVALLLVGSMTLPTLAGCGGQATPPPPVDATRGQAPMRPAGGQKMGGGMSTRKKVILLAGAAAIYYMYKKHKNAQNQASNVQYYLSKNGKVYYRDPKTHGAVYVTAPAQPFQVPESEAADYQQFQGYNNNTSGKSSFDGLIPTGPGM